MSIPCGSFFFVCGVPVAHLFRTLVAKLGCFRFKTGKQNDFVVCHIVFCIK